MSPDFKIIEIGPPKIDHTENKEKRLIRPRLENKSVWYTIPLSTSFREIKANPLKMDGHVSQLVNIRVCLFPFFFSFLWLFLGGFL